MRKWFLIPLVGMIVAFPPALQSAEIEWTVGFLDDDEDVSGFGTSVEAYAFTGELGRNALARHFSSRRPVRRQWHDLCAVEFLAGRRTGVSHGNDIH